MKFGAIELGVPLIFTIATFDIVIGIRIFLMHIKDIMVVTVIDFAFLYDLFELLEW